MTIPRILLERIARFEDRHQKLLNGLRGIASCGTRCGCCEMHKRIAEELVADDVKAQDEAPDQH